jgi:type IV secretory pathway TrbD component
MQVGTTRDAGMQSQRRMPIHAALVRPILFAGADRELTLANGVICIALLFGIGVSRYTVSVVVVLLTVGHWALARTTKADSSFRHVYLRHIRLRPFYPAAGAPRARTAIIHPSIPLSE